MKTRKTFREVAEWMDDRSIENKMPSPEYELRSLAKQHRWINFDETNILFRNIIDRHKSGTNSKEISFLFYNTWLIDGVVGYGSAPWLSLRADLIGKEIRNSGYDVAALCEVFEEKYQKIIKKLRFPYDAMGPVWTVGNISSGLYTLSKFPLIYKRHRFVAKGSFPDNFSNKGVLLTVIDMVIGKIDLYTTHLFWGSEDVSLRGRTNVHVKQLKELTEFIKETHNPKHVVIVAGDMNINPGKSDENGRAYEKMKALFSNITLKDGSKISLEDLWKIRGGKKGGTNMPTKGCEIDINRYIGSTSGICYCNDETNETDEAKNDEGRYDYIFVQKPVSSHEIIVDFSRMKRRPFPFPDLSYNDIKIYKNHPVHGPLFINRSTEQITSVISEIIKKDCNYHLSDHIGVDVKFLVNKKN